ncbi:hypothetical protein SAMN05444000_10431 [Shimia gijangensis]|uniref:Uncharacterized protein n=2 Tax=Shimia gijangensis TaxID=1470563 RepID=A0A1M6FC54_9RHOB|nr:hypothetical protein SAMN05444000_10431 [Shimia gijangensis]
MEVTPTENGLIRLFSVDLPPEEITLFRTRSFDKDGEQSSWPLWDALDPTYLDEDFIEFCDIASLEDLGLTGYMTEGLGVSEVDVAQDAARLSAITGHVLIVFSSAFDGIAQTLTPRAPLRWIGTYREDKAPVVFAPLPSEAAKGILAPAAPAHPSPHLTLIWALLALPIVALFLAAVIYGVTR